MARVLLVDDDPEIVQFLATLLELEGYPTTQATRGEDALSASAAEPPSAVLVDLAMPGLDGFDLCRRLRASGLACPILVISARPGADLARRAHEAGADDFIRKPFDNADLLSRLRHWMAARPGAAAPPA
jgi:DNA-binding response OmpR family regulator